MKGGYLCDMSRTMDQYYSLQGAMPRLIELFCSVVNE